MPLGEGIRAVSMMDDRNVLKVWEEERWMHSEAHPATACPTPEELWAAVRGRLEASQVAALLDHVLDCAACGETFQIARSACEDSREDNLEQRPRSWLRMGLAAAAVVGAVALIVSLPFLRGDGPRQRGLTYRNASTPSIDSAIEAGTALSRRAFVLRWTEAPKGTLYTVEIAARDLEPLYRAEEIAETEILVPEEVFGSLPKGTTILWRVDAVLPDATHISSPTFRVVLE